MVKKFGNQQEVEDRRMDARLPVDLWVRQELAGESSYSHASDLSAGGMQMDHGLPYPIGTKVNLRFKLANDDHIFSMAAEVVSARWVDGKPITNLKFLDLAGDDYIRITQFVEDNLPDEES